MKDEFETDNCVTYQKIGDDCVIVHLGFLQVNHRYIIDLRLPHSLYKANDDEPVTLVPDRSGVPNIHCKVVANGDEFESLQTIVAAAATSAEPKSAAVTAAGHDAANSIAATAKGYGATTLAADASGESEKPADGADYHYIKVEYFAHKEKLLREELKLINSKNAEELLKLVITARVLGKGKGTPMLRNGIHCLGFEGDEESSEQSDVAGCSGAGDSRAGH